MSKKLPVNPIKPQDTVTVGGKEYKLSFQFDAVAEAEDETGVVLILTVCKPTVSNVRAIFYALIKPNHPETTFAEVKSMITMKTVLDIWLACAHVWAAANNDPSPEDGSEKN